MPDGIFDTVGLIAFSTNVTCLTAFVSQSIKKHLTTPDNS